MKWPWAKSRLELEIDKKKKLKKNLDVGWWVVTKLSFKPNRQTIRVFSEAVLTEATKIVRQFLE